MPENRSHYILILLVRILLVANKETNKPAYVAKRNLLYSYRGVSQNPKAEMPLGLRKELESRVGKPSINVLSPSLTMAFLHNPHPPTLPLIFLLCMCSNFPFSSASLYRA